MNSIRARLTFSYAVIVALVLIVVALLASRLLFEVLARPSFDALSASDVRARAVVAAHPTAAAEALVPLVETAAEGAGVTILRRLGDGPGGPGGPGAGGPGPPGEGGPPPDGLPPDGLHPPDDAGPPPHAPHRIDGDGLLHTNALAWMLGLGPRRIEVRGSAVLIAPDLGLVEPAAISTLGALAGAIVVSIVAGLLCGRWLAAQALAPLVSVTEQLERFSDGDFATRTIVTSDTAELGRLTSAYNGAVDQVSLAMTERTKIEQRLRRFLADAGHELRTPITVIGGYVQILRKGGFEDRDIREIALETLESEVRRSRSLVERLLTLARLERPERSDVATVDLEVLVRESIANVTRARGGDVTLVCETTSVVLADPVELHEAIENLIDNAVKYGEGTPVRVAIVSEPGREIVRVSDGGYGIPHEYRERIFERFFRVPAHREIAGSGLGLAIGERAAARFGGTIDLENASPGATTFRLTLPSASSTRADRAAILM